jgi:electron transport complex protein RnfG
MKQETNFGYILRLTLTLLLICAVVAAALAGVNAITKDKIAAAKAEKTQKAIQAVLPGVNGVKEVPFTDATGLVTKVYKSDMSLSSDSDSAFGYAVEVTPAGFGGTITMMVGVGADGKVLGISIISHSETPGLGAVSAAATDKGLSFREQFKGLLAGISIGDGENQIDSLSSATITSQAIVDGVNAALECIKNMG